MVSEGVDARIHKKQSVDEDFLLLWVLGLPRWAEDRESCLVVLGLTNGSFGEFV